jgi:UDP-glucose 4-epimerase
MKGPGEGEILVTGGAGFIGSHVVLALALQGYKCIIFDNFSNSSREVISRLESCTGDEVKFFIGDICNENDLDEVFREHNVTDVIHCAGLKSVEESFAVENKYRQVNVYGTLMLLEKMKRYGCNALIFSSSATVYGTPSYLPCDEEHPVAPLSPYGETKLEAENIIKEWALNSDSRTAVVLRYFNPVGCEKSGLLGENPTQLATNLFPVILDLIEKKREELYVFGCDYETADGTGARDYIHVSDLADAHIAALENFKNIAKYEEINVGTGCSYTVLEVLDEFSSVLGQRIPYIIKERREGDVGEIFTSRGRARSLLNWSPRLTLSAMCRDSLNSRGLLDWQK